MLISIDHGNKQIKTNHRTFVSGLRESDTKPPFGKDVLFYKGKYYTLTDQRIPYMRDKTADERYFSISNSVVAVLSPNFACNSNSLKFILIHLLP